MYSPPFVRQGKVKNLCVVVNRMRKDPDPGSGHFRSIGVGGGFRFVGRLGVQPPSFQ